MNLHQDDLHLLPPNMQWLAKAIGLRGVLALVKEHGGGMPLYVPVKVTPDHPLLHLLGEAAFSALVDEYGGTHIAVARCEKAARVLVYRQIRRARENGKTQHALARSYGYTVRHIRNIQSRGAERDKQQQPLF